MIFDINNAGLAEVGNIRLVKKQEFRKRARLKMTSCIPKCCRDKDPRELDNKELLFT